MKYKTSTVQTTMLTIIVLGGLLGGTFSGVLAQQNTAPRMGRTAMIAVTDIQGTVQILPRAATARGKEGARILAEDAWKAASPKMMLNPGDQLRTGENSAIQLQLQDGTTLALSSDSLLVVEELRSARGEAPPTTQLKLERGKVSTRQLVSILGQTNQIIRTDNGSVNTSLGEVEVWKPEQESKQYTLLASRSSHIPQVAALFDKKDESYVTLRRGSAEIAASGTGKIITNSLVLPDACLAQDGVKFTLSNPNAKVNVAKLEDENGFRFFSAEPFYLLAATESDANKVEIATYNSAAEVDIEGLSVLAQQKNARSMLVLNELLTVGVLASDLKVNLICDDAESKGVTEFEARGIEGDVTILNTDFGGMAGTDRPDPSRGRTSEVLPVRVTPTPTPTPRISLTPTPTPTPAPTQTPVPAAPITEPVTHTFPQAPFITNITVSPVLNADNCGGTNNYSIGVIVNFNNYLPTIQGGRLVSVETDGTWVPYAIFTYPIPDPHSGPRPYLSLISYNYAWPMEQGIVRYYFCYIPEPPNTPPDSVYFIVHIEDSAGNVGAPCRCSGLVTGPVTCGP